MQTEQTTSVRMSFPGLSPLEQTYEKFKSLQAARDHVYGHPDPHFGAAIVGLTPHDSERWYMVAPLSSDTVGKYSPKNSCLILRSPPAVRESTAHKPATIKTKSGTSPVATDKPKRSAANGVCAQARNIYIEMGDTRTKPDFIQRCIDAGINKSTAGVRWLKCNREFGNE